jgi:hypothetical protein
MTKTLESAVEFLDLSPLPHARAEVIARRLCRHLETMDWAESTFLNSQGQSTTDLERARDAIRNRRDEGPSDGARERLILSTGPGSTPLDGYLLEFLIHWARLLRIPEEEIEAAVLESLPEMPAQTSH